MTQNRRLILAHFWVAFGVFVAAALLGVWQMWVRSPLGAHTGTPGDYYMSVTAHGVAMAYVLSTFFIMGFGYFVAETALGRGIPGVRIAWAGFVAGAIGVVMAVLTILAGNGSVLYSFYPPLTAGPFLYVGLVLVVAGSWVWCVIMIVAMAQWKRANPGWPVPLAMFATVANAILWLWTTAGVAAELLFQLIPAARDRVPGQVNFQWAGFDNVRLTVLCPRRAAQCHAHPREQLLNSKGLRQVIRRTNLHRFYNRFDLSNTGKDDDRERRMNRFHVRENFNAILPWQHDVQENHGREISGRQALDCLVARPQTIHSVS